MITQLNIHHLRNLQALSLRTGVCNLIVGQNGSGKTSVLEAVYLLSRGKSFRHYQPKRYISHHEPMVVIHAKLNDGSSMAIQKSVDASTIMRIDQQTVYLQSLLTKRLPTLLIDPSSMDMLEVGSSSRRQLLDWIVFHVKPDFHLQWSAYQRLLKQRNTLLRSSNTLTAIQRKEIIAWDKGIANHAALITHYRQQVFDAWLPIFTQFITKLLPEDALCIKLKFSPGYDTAQSLEALLASRLDQDCQMGYTRIGCHRADIQILWIDDREYEAASENPATSKKTPVVRDQAANILSRGEKKLLITALKLSQLPLLSQIDASNGKSNNIDNTTVKGSSETVPIVLLDDIAAELDENALTLLLDSLANIPCQLFITNLDFSIQDKIKQYWPIYNMFHMEQGRASNEKTIDT